MIIFTFLYNGYFLNEFLYNNFSLLLEFLILNFSLLLESSLNVLMDKLTKHPFATLTAHLKCFF